MDEKKKLIINLDINKTLIFGDSAKSQDIKPSIIAFLNPSLYIL